VTTTYAPDVIGFAVSLLSGIVSGTILAGVPIRGGMLEPGDGPPAILLEEAGAIHDSGVAAYLPFRVALTTFGVDEETAAAMWREAAFLLHRRRPAVVNGVMAGGIFDETGPQPRRDPGTSWAARWGVFGFYMADQVTA
jgi:hypothetical protein